MELPANLLQSIESGNIVLVLGAGASIGASSPAGTPAPTGPQLAGMIANKFLGGQHAGDSLPIVSELAISESDLYTLQEYIRTIFHELQPASFHSLLPTFKWAGLATTNYDLVIERAYSQCRNRAQALVPLIKNGDRVEEHLRSSQSVMLLKLHGCITRTSDSSAPLILSVDQYVTHRRGRDRVFDHLKNLSYEHPLVFVGHSLQDPDIRQLLLEMGTSDQRPRYYIVTPQVTGPERRLWESRRITPLEGSFEDFLETLDEKVNSVFRGIVPSPIITDLPISERFVIRDPGLTSNCLEFLENDVDYIRHGMAIEDLDPRLFYRGFNPHWAAVERDLDVRRDIEDTILSDAILVDETDKGSHLFAIKGHAGSGKSVLLQRVAWEAAMSFNKLCLYLRPHGQLSFDAVRELSRVIDDRIYLFIDDVGEQAGQTLQMIKQARGSSLALTICTAERINEWNMSCEDLEPYLDDDFEVGYLSPKEIDRLLELLAEHHALFRLEQASQDERRTAFVERAGRQLLVALHEATLGKPFEDIIADEFAEIQPDHARLTYLGICFLNRFDVPVRAGIISRVYGVRFTDFEERYFQPLEGLVFSRFDRRTRDYVYLTRHPHIADIVVNRVLGNASDRLDMYIRMINAMNIDYDADRIAYRKLIRGRFVLETFPDHQMSEVVYSVAQEKVGEDPYLLHQMSIYEMNRANGNLNKAADYLARARVLEPLNRTVTHSLAELQLRRAESARSILEFHTHLREAQILARTLSGSFAVDSHGFHTLAKVHIAKLRKQMEGDVDRLGELEFSEAIREGEETIQQGLQKFPGDPYLLSAEAEWANLLSDNNRAIVALRAAFQANVHNSFIAVRLAKLLMKIEDIGEAMKVYKAAIDSGVNDKQVHFNYAKLLIDGSHGDMTEIEYHLRRAFTEGDSNLEAQFWYARQLYINGRIGDAEKRFSELRRLPVNPTIKRAIRGIILDDGLEKRFTGRVEKKEVDYGFVMRDGTADRVFLHIKNIEEVVWVDLHRATRIAFSLGFNFWGAAATNVTLE